MTNAATDVNTLAAAEIDALDAVLADFDLEGGEEVIGEEILEADAGEAEVIEEATVLGDDALADLDLALNRSEIYEEQTSDAIASVEPVDPTAAKAPKKPRVAKAAGAAASTRTPRDMNSVASEFFVLRGDVSTMSDEDKDAAKAATIATKPAQVKIAEKFENLFTALSVNKAPSTYVMIAFALLEAKKSVTSGDIVGAYKASGLGEGTARSQSGQIMHLFATVGIATRSSQTLTLNADSLVAERLRSLPVVAAS
jgi:hypothetical protein